MNSDVRYNSTEDARLTVSGYVTSSDGLCTTFSAVAKMIKCKKG